MMQIKKIKLPKQTVLYILAALLVSCSSKESDSPKLFNAWAISGELSDESIILHARITSSDSLVNNDVPGTEATGYFEVSEDQEFKNPLRTAWLTATYENDYVLKTRVKALKSGTQYYYRVLFGRD